MGTEILLAKTEKTIKKKNTKNTTIAFHEFFLSRFYCDLSTLTPDTKPSLKSSVSTIV